VSTKDFEVSDVFVRSDEFDISLAFSSSEDMTISATVERPQTSFRIPTGVRSTLVISVERSGGEGIPVGQSGGNAVAVGVGVGVGVVVLVAVGVGVFILMKRRKKENITVEREGTTDCEMDSHQYQSDYLDSDDTKVAKKGVFGVDVWATVSNHLPGSFLDFNVEEALLQ
jgi:hypothetical protein